jgi:hypothetical protein
LHPTQNNVAKRPTGALLLYFSAGFFCWRLKEKKMAEETRYIRARIKTHQQLVKVYPEAKCWGKPISSDHVFPSADEIIMPYLGKTVSLRKKRHDLFRFYYEIKSSGELIAMPNWIEFFDSEDLVAPAKWKDIYDPSVIDDTWLNYYESRFVIIEDLLIITG